MRLVTSMMTTTEMTDDEINKAVEIFLSEFQTDYKSYKYNYDDNKYCEVDIDLLDVTFTKDTMDKDLHKLIVIYEKIMKLLPQEIDFIASNDDTSTEVLKYEKDNTDIKNFGLFVTNRKIPEIEPYYTSEICNAYVNLDHVSFGVYD